MTVGSPTCAVLNTSRPCCPPHPTLPSDSVGPAQAGGRGAGQGGGGAHGCGQRGAGYRRSLCKGRVGCLGRDASRLCSAHVEGVSRQEWCCNQSSRRVSRPPRLQPRAHPCLGALPAAALSRSRGQLPGLQPLQRVHRGHRLRRQDGAPAGAARGECWAGRTEGRPAQADAHCSDWIRCAVCPTSPAPPACPSTLPSTPPSPHLHRWRCGTCAT